MSVGGAQVGKGGARCHDHSCRRAQDACHHPGCNMCHCHARLPRNCGGNAEWHYIPCLAESSLMSLSSLHSTTPWVEPEPFWDSNRRAASPMVSFCTTHGADLRQIVMLVSSPHCPAAAEALNARLHGAALASAERLVAGQASKPASPGAADMAADTSAASRPQQEKHFVAGSAGAAGSKAQQDTTRLLRCLLHQVANVKVRMLPLPSM